MHLAIAAWTIFAVWRWGDWRSWRAYYPTMLYMSLGACVYLFLYGKDTLWNPRESLLLDKQNELLYLFVIMPGSALLFLTNMPVDWKGRIVRIGKWILLYILAEWIGYRLQFITYNSGWSLWWSLIFDCLMFPLLLLHHYRPLIAWVITLGVSAGLMSLFTPAWS